MIKGAEQAFSTTIPEVMHFKTLIKCMEFLKEEETENVSYLALDNYEAQFHLNKVLQANKFRHGKYIVAIGAERGWSKRERDILRMEGFTLAHLGDRVLKVDVTCIVGMSIVKSEIVAI